VYIEFYTRPRVSPHETVLAAVWPSRQIANADLSCHKGRLMLSNRR